jgi:hypothetical protein
MPVRRRGVATLPFWHRVQSPAGIWAGYAQAPCHHPHRETMLLHLRHNRQGRLSSRPVRPVGALPRAVSHRRRLASRAVLPVGALPRAVSHRRRLAGWVVLPVGVRTRVVNHRRRLAGRAVRPVGALPRVVNHRRRLASRPVLPVGALTRAASCRRQTRLRFLVLLLCPRYRPPNTGQPVGVSRPGNRQAVWGKKARLHILREVALCSGKIRWLRLTRRHGRPRMRSRRWRLPAAE